MRECRAMKLSERLFRAYANVEFTVVFVANQDVKLVNEFSQLAGELHSEKSNCRLGMCLDN